MSSQPSAVRTPAESVGVFALLGNPNTGKSTLFGALTGVRQKVANFPGVTVEAKLGQRTTARGSSTFIDLPGTYSLAARSPDERVALQALLGRLEGIPAPHGVLIVVDATSLDRNLYLASQVLELDLPAVVALTMVDVAERRGIEIDVEQLSEALGAPVVPVNAPRGEGLEELVAALEAVAEQARPPLVISYAEELRHAVDTVLAELESGAERLGWTPCRSDALRLVVDGDGPFLSEVEERLGGDFLSRYRSIRESASQERAPSLIEAQARYGQIALWSRGCRRVTEQTGTTWTERIDGVLTHKLWGSLTFVVVMGLLFQSIFAWSSPLMDGIESLFGALGGWIGAGLPEGPLRGLLVDGIIGGVGGVVVFLPQILILFCFIAVLEDLGYMTRAAFLMDNLMAKFSLSGRSFIPLLSSFACAVPGIMGARVIEDRATRLTTIFLAPFMSCSARLPVYTLMIGAFVPARTVWGFLELQGIVLFAMYFVGIAAAVPTAWLVQRFWLKGHRSAFLLELPSYKMPRIKAVALTLWQRGGAFVRRAGTIILAVSIVVWALAYFPRSETVLERFETSREQARETYRSSLATSVQELGLPGREGDPETVMEETAAAESDQADRARVRLKAARDNLDGRLVQLDGDEQGELLATSYLGRAGRLIEPIVEPLGWDWRIGMATLASFPAREVIVATLGTIFHLSDVDEESESLRDVLRDAKRPDGGPLFTLATGLSVMIFFALCAQCAATLATMRRETASWRWPLLSFAYMTSLAYLAAFAVYQIARAAES